MEDKFKEIESYVNNYTEGEYKSFSDTNLVLEYIRHLQSTNKMDNEMFEKLKDAGLVADPQSSDSIECAVMLNQPAIADVKLPTYGGKWGYVCEEVLTNKLNLCEIGMGRGQILVGRS